MITLQSRTGQELGAPLDLRPASLQTIFMHRNSKSLSTPVTSVFLFFGLLWAWMPTARSESVAAFVSKEEAIREQMITISRELGVTCTECHKVSNFADGSKKSFKVGLEHMKLTQMLKDNGLDGKKGPAATCYMCHRGKLMPEYKEPTAKKAH